MMNETEGPLRNISTAHVW